MDYSIRILPSERELEACPLFHVDHFQWTCRRKPPTSGRMGYLPDRGLLVRMASRERDPKRVETQPQAMVCKDSAMEVFLALPDHPLPAGEPFLPRNDGLYLNFEVNPNGAMYAKTGHGRQNRRPITGEEYRLTGVQAWVEPECWGIQFVVPNPLIRRLCGIERFRAGDRLYCNFYKISEDPEIEHYASYRPIQSDRPNFHQPEQFARAVFTQSP